MLSPHEIATLLLAAASLGPADLDAIDPPDLAALEQQRLVVQISSAAGEPRVVVTANGRELLRRLGLQTPPPARTCATGGGASLAGAAHASQHREEQA
ncbi:hypothetical protein PTE30175_00392 [Pandoraea terrae]|uniref:Preprotein translocase subunit SecA n=1 Tax=Pandoraea terrae TaxID=1537710 RepID=A0A5E4RWW2_9BURK|nr:hypothetical protein [Pandoraea terrae]VVD66924.1 hypothetical protein PTE30175_00392 [Pandoraea terrae]